MLNFLCGQKTCGVETTNGATVVVCMGKVEGTAPPFSSIYLFTTDYIPYIDTGLGIATASDIDGYYSFDGIKADTFSLTVVNNADSRSAVLLGYQNATLQAKLELPGSLEGKVSSNENGTTLVFVYGTGYYTLLKSAGSFEFDSLPGGRYKIQAARIVKRAFPAKPMIEALSEIQEIVIMPGKKITVPELFIP